MEPDGSSPDSQEPASCSYPQPAQGIPTSHFLKIHFNIIVPSTTSLPSGLFTLALPTKTLYVPILSPHQNFVYSSYLTKICYISRLYYSLLFNLFQNVR